MAGTILLKLVSLSFGRSAADNSFFPSSDDESTERNLKSFSIVWSSPSASGKLKISWEAAAAKLRDYGTVEQRFALAQQLEEKPSPYLADKSAAD